MPRNNKQITAVVFLQFPGSCEDISEVCSLSHLDTKEGFVRGHSKASKAFQLTNTCLPVSVMGGESRGPNEALPSITATCFETLALNQNA